jgi:hypothetical protein
VSLPPALYGNLATLVVAAHFTFLMFVTAGGFLLFRWPRVAWLHLPCFLWGGYIELTGGICPLTPLENRLRRAAGGAEYAGTFIEHYLVPILYPSGLTRTIQVGLGAGLLLLNVGIYAWVIRRRRSRAGGATG